MGILILIISLSGCHFIEVQVQETMMSKEMLKVEYIDVGQADAVLIQSQEEVMLIDAGDNKTEEELVAYLQAKGITRIDYLIGTHPHADHIGGLDQVILQFDIGKIYMPKVTHTTKTFESVLQAAKDKNYKISTGKAGEDFTLGETIEVKMLSPLKEKYKELNDYSIVVQVVNGEDIFLFMGDAEAEVEEDLLNTYPNLQSDVLKVGHHGSSSSTTEDFLYAVNPSLAIISSGEDNSYGHPHKETIELLEKHEVAYYDTQEVGSITLTSVGNGEIEISTEK